jgi:hypothetical protein
MKMEPFEWEAITQMVLNTRAIAQTLGVDQPHCRKMLIWAQIIEDWQQKQTAHLDQGGGIDNTDPTTGVRDDSQT